MWGSRCSSRSWTCRRAPYLDTPRAEGVASWDSPRWVGSGNRDLWWATTCPCQHPCPCPTPPPSQHPCPLTPVSSTPSSLSSSLCQPNTGISVLVPLPTPHKHSCPDSSACPMPTSHLPHPAAVHAPDLWEPPHAQPLPKHPCPRRKGSSWASAANWLPAPLRPGTQLWGRGVSIFSCLQWDLAAGRPLP